MNRRVLHPKELLHAVTPMLKGLLGEDVALRVVADPQTANVSVDQSQFEQVIVNLAINARDAMAGGGTLTLETRNVSLDETYCGPRGDVKPGHYVEFAVTDTGAGMSAEVQSRLFEPFFTTKAPGKGTGLGLATSHGIVKQNGGHIAVYSEPGRGTSVRVYFPRVQGESEQQAPSAQNGTAPGGTETILLVEDSSMVRELVADELRRVGYTVVVAASAADALKFAQGLARPVDLLLTDVVLPGMSGVELAETMSAKGEVPVIFMSGYTRETISQRGVDPGRRVFLAKPFMVDTLLHLLRKVLETPRA